MYFIGLVFDVNSNHYKRARFLQDRFDHKSKFNRSTPLSLLPPFHFSGKKATNHLYDLLSEVVEDHLEILDAERASQIVFNCLDFGPDSRPSLYLSPTLPEEFFHLLEDLYESLLGQEAVFKQRQDPFNPLWPLARGIPGGELPSIITKAQEMLPLPVVLNPLCIEFFEKGRDGAWASKKLFTFRQAKANLDVEFNY